jgi:hypothetical protein
VGNGGTIVAVQVVAAELKPEPVKVKTELMVPDVGVTITSAVTLNVANGVMSSEGLPLTVRFHAILVVASGLTTKVPCAVPEETMEQVWEVIRLVSSVLVLVALL